MKQFLIGVIVVHLLLLPLLILDVYYKKQLVRQHTKIQLPKQLVEKPIEPEPEQLKPALLPVDRNWTVDRLVTGAKFRLTKDLYLKGGSLKTAKSIGEIGPTNRYVWILYYFPTVQDRLLPKGTELTLASYESTHSWANHLIKDNEAVMNLVTSGGNSFQLLTQGGRDMRLLEGGRYSYVGKQRPMTIAELDSIFYLVEMGSPEIITTSPK